MDITILPHAEAHALIATARPTGVAVTVCSGKFLQGYALPSGDHIDHYLDFGWSNKYVLTPAGHREPVSIARHREW